MPLPSDDQHILEIANSIALSYARNTCWSTWHSWDFFRRLRSDVVADQPPVSTEFWEATRPFGTCVDIALQTTAAFQAELKRVPNLSHYAKQVRSLARAGSANDSNSLTHCITAFLAETFCVLIDFSCNHKAILIPVDSHAESLPYHNMHGNTFKDRLVYKVINGDKVVIREQQNANEATRFQEFDERTLIRRINIRLAKEMEDVPKVPKTKSVKFQTFLPHQPTEIPWAPFEQGYIATTCRVKIDFVNRKILMQVPYRDWLRQEENASLLQEARSTGAFNHMNDAACNLIVILNQSRNNPGVRDKISIIAKIGEKHGLNPCELDRMIDSIYEVWEALVPSHHPG